MAANISLTYYSDVLCVWAHISQIRVDELAKNFADDITISYRYCSVFGDTAHKIGVGWKERGGYEGFRKHLHESIKPFDHITLHPEIWQKDRPTSSMPAHIVLKAVQHVDAEKCKAVLEELRRAFFERCLDISSWPVLQGCLEAVGVDVSNVREMIDSGAAHAELEADYRDQQQLLVQGSPTYILNEGRQKLYGNVGYSVIEANIAELLRSPAAGSASWC